MKKTSTGKQSRQEFLKEIQDLTDKGLVALYEKIDDKRHACEEKWDLAQLKFFNGRLNLIDDECGRRVKIINRMRKSLEKRLETLIVL